MLGGMRAFRINPLLSCRRRVSCRLVGLFLLAALGVANAGTLEEPPQAPSRQAIQDGLGEVQDLAAALYAARAEPLQTQLQVLFSLRPDRRFGLQGITLSVDGERMAEHTYSAAEIAALADGAAQPLLSLHLPPGEHRLTAHWQGEAPRSEQLQRGLAWSVRSGQGRQVVLLQLARAEGEDLPRLTARPVTRLLAIQYRAARFEQALGRPLAASARLLAERGFETGASTEDVDALLAELYLQQGLTLRAAAQLQRLARADDRSWLSLARQQAWTGDAAGALQALARIGDGLPEAMARERVLLEGRLLLAVGRLPAARQRLQRLVEDGGRADEAAYGRFNLAVALRREGDAEAAREALDELGRARGGGAERQALRDKANLTLAYDRLQAGELEPAARYFKRARLEGPLSSTALLGLGRVYAAEEAYKKALVPWLRLSKRDPSDPAVQDALLAVPYALGKLNAYKQALAYYKQAVASFRLEAERLAKIRQTVDDGSLVQTLQRAFVEEAGGLSQARLRRLPAATGATHLWQLYSTNLFQQDLRNSAQITGSLEKIHRWTSEISSDSRLATVRRRALLAQAADLENRLKPLSHQLEQHMQGLARQELSRRDERIKAYAEEARFSIAQIYDYAAKRWGER